jgi:hypothetical protein
MAKVDKKEKRSAEKVDQNKLFTWQKLQSF